MGMVRDYNQIRKAVFDRDGHKCQSCGVSEKEAGFLLVHHLDESGGLEDPFFRYANNEISNLLTLCGSCHGRKYHKRPKSSGILHLEPKPLR